MRFVKGVREAHGGRRALTCPEDSEPTRAASSYVYRSLVPPDFRPIWEKPAVDGSTVLVVCDKHMEQQVYVHGGERTRTPPRYPFRLVLRASGAVQRIPNDRIVLKPIGGMRPRFARLYPGEDGYEVARR